MTSFPPTALEMSFMTSGQRAAAYMTMTKELDVQQRAYTNAPTEARKAECEGRILKIQAARKACRHMNRLTVSAPKMSNES